MFVTTVFVRKNNACVAFMILGALALLMVATAKVATGQQTPRRFTVADDIELTRFNNSFSLTLSPDGKYFIVLSERGRLDLNRPESSVRVYLMQDIHQFLSQTEITGEPQPLWVFSKVTYKDGPNITAVRWLSDSSAIAFLSKTASGFDQLLVADIKTKTIQPLTPEDQHVTAYDVRSANQFTYCVLSSAIRLKAVEGSRAPAIVGTGRSLPSLIFPEEGTSPNVWVHDLSE